MFKHSAALSLCTLIIFIAGGISSAGGAAVGKDSEVDQTSGAQSAEVIGQPCGYPKNIRDGLAPAQYFRMAEVLLDDYDITNAERCLKKLRDHSASAEAQRYADLLEKAMMPKEAVPGEALKLLRDAEKVEKEGNFDKAQGMYCTLVTKFPHFEWAYVSLANHYAYYRRDQKTAEELLEKALAVNPNSEYALQACVTLAKNMMQHEKAYAYCLRIRAIDPTYSTYDLDCELDNHDRGTRFTCKVHRAAPRVIAAAPQVANVCAPVSKRKPGNDKMPEALRASLYASARESIRLTGERAEKYPPQMINEKGAVQIAFGPNVETRESFSNNLLAVQSGNRTQYWNKQGKLAFARSFDSGKNFSEDLAAVKDDGWGFIDGTGQFVIANTFEYAESFSEGLAAVVKDGGYGFVNKKGEMVIEPIYELVLPFSNGLALVKLRDKIGYLNKNGHLAILASFDSGRSFSEGLAEVGFLDHETHELRLCYINTSGKVCIDTSKIEVLAEPADKEQDIFKLDDGKTVFGFKRATGMSSSDKLPRDFHCGLAGIQLGENYGYINKDGKVVIKPVYRAAYDFSENLATVRPRFCFEKAVIDTSGNEVVSPQYKEISQFHDGIAAVSQWELTSTNALWGFINKKGEQILPLQYFEAAPFANGLARVQPTPMSIAAAKSAAANIAPVEPAQASPALSTDTSQWAQITASKIAAAWPADIVCEVDKRVRYTFKLDHAGNAYDITFMDGCASPRTMLATVHSLLFAMPYEKPRGSAAIVLDLEPGSQGKPKITISGYLERKAAETEAGILDSMPDKPKVQDKSILRDWIYEKLFFLCEKLAKYPDSPSVKAELVKTFQALGLNAASAHDWLCVARSNPPSLTLRQNPDDRDQRNCNAPLGAIFQAWQLQKGKDNLYELEDAYRYKLALDLLRSNGDKTLFLGIAAELMDEYSTAVKNYSKCASASLLSSSSFAKELMTRFSGKATVEPVGKLAGDSLDSLDWRGVVKWLPIDSEVLIAVLNPQPTVCNANRMVSSLFDSMQSMLGATKEGKSDIRFALHGGRNFQAPRDIGLGKQAGADIRIFARRPLESDSASEDVTATIERLEGFDVVVEELKPKYSQSSLSFIARPFADVEISATNRHYLRQILSRINNKPVDRAFPDNLPEWATIDLKADCWSLRHFDRGCAPFDCSAPGSPVNSENKEDEDNDAAVAGKSCSGFSFCGSSEGTFRVSYLGSDPETLEALTASWNRYPEINTGQFWGTGKGPKDYQMSPFKVTFSAGKKVATITGKTTTITAPMVNLILLHQLGYMIAL